MSSKSTQRLVGGLIIVLGIFVAIYVTVKQPNQYVSEREIQFNDGVTLLSQADRDTAGEASADQSGQPNLVPISQLKEAIANPSAAAKRYTVVGDKEDTSDSHIRQANPGESVLSENDAEQSSAADRPLSSKEKAQAKSQTHSQPQAQDHAKAKPAIPTTIITHRRHELTLPKHPHANAKHYWAVQVGTFKTSSHADKLVSNLRQHGESAYYGKIPSTDKKPQSFGVYLGPYSKEGKALTIAKKMPKRYQLQAVVVPYHS